MTRILVTNDDGLHSPGIHALAESLRALGAVTVVAPLGESSAIGHALTLARPLRLEQHGTDLYSVDGTPTDCVNVAVTRGLDGAPDLIVSGINKGFNLGDDVTYSGTVAGALEGALEGRDAGLTFKRTRVCGRQVYVFSHAQVLGWKGVDEAHKEIVDGIANYNKA